MPTFYQSEERLEQEIREGELERDFLLRQQAQKEAHELQVIAERGKVAETRLKMTHKANSRASIWTTFFSILPKTVVIISSFWLIVFKKPVPKSWDEYLKS